MACDNCSAKVLTKESLDFRTAAFIFCTDFVSQLSLTFVLRDTAVINAQKVTLDSRMSCWSFDLPVQTLLFAPFALSQFRIVDLAF